MRELRDLAAPARMADERRTVDLQVVHEARDIRDLYSGVRIGGIIALVISGVVALAAAVVLYLNRGSAPTDEDDDGEDYDLDDLTGR